MKTSFILAFLLLFSSSSFAQEVKIKLKIAFEVMLCLDMNTKPLCHNPKELKLTDIFLKEQNLLGEVVYLGEHFESVHSEELNTKFIAQFFIFKFESHETFPYDYEIQAFLTDKDGNHIAKTVIHHYGELKDMTTETQLIGPLHFIGDDAYSPILKIAAP